MDKSKKRIIDWCYAMGIWNSIVIIILIISLTDILLKTHAQGQVFDMLAGFPLIVSFLIFSLIIIIIAFTLRGEFHYYIFSLVTISPAFIVPIGANISLSENKENLIFVSFFSFYVIIIIFLSFRWFFYKRYR